MIVDDVRFIGPAHMPDSTDERQVISELKQHMFDRGSEGLDEVLEVRVKSARKDQGYFKVTASGETRIISSDSTYEHVVVTIHVDPGLQYKLGDVRFREGDPIQALVFAPEELRKQILLQDGEIFNVTKIRESLDAMKRLYGSQGYINLVAIPVTEVDDAAQRISLIMELDQGRQFRVRKVEVFGLEPSKAAVLTSEVKPGDIFQYGIVEAFVKANLPGSLDVTSSEVLDMHKSEKEGTVDVVVDFRRLSNQRF